MVGTDAISSITLVKNAGVGGDRAVGQFIGSPMGSGVWATVSPEIDSTVTTVVARCCPQPASLRLGDFGCETFAEGGVHMFQEHCENVPHMGRQRNGF